MGLLIQLGVAFEMGFTTGFFCHFHFLKLPLDDADSFFNFVVCNSYIELIAKLHEVADDPIHLLPVDDGAAAYNDGSQSTGIHRGAAMNYEWHRAFNDFRHPPD